MSRIPSLDPGEYDAEQSRVAAEIARLRHGAVRGPFSAWIRLPAVADHANQLGDALRNTPHLPLRLYRLAAVLVARHWSAHYEWHIHARGAVEAGIDAGVVEAIRARAEPEFARDDERVTYRLVTELQETRALSRTTFDESVACLGREGVIALVGTLGFFTMAAQTLNAFDITAPGGGRPLEE